MCSMLANIVINLP